MERYLTEDGKVMIITKRTLPRYSIESDSVGSMDYSDMLDDFKSEYPMYVKGRFSDLSSEDTEVHSLSEYQKYLDNKYGKDNFEAFVLGVYEHGGVSFSINKTGNHVCHWDSTPCIGFIGIPKGASVDEACEELHALYNGMYEEVRVVDNLTDDIVDSEIVRYDKAREVKDRFEEKYL